MGCCLRANGRIRNLAIDFRKLALPRFYISALIPSLEQEISQIAKR